MTQIYKCGRFRNVGKFEYTADFANAASPIWVRFADDCTGDEGKWQSTPFQVADCRHSRREAERAIAQYFR